MNELIKRQIKVFLKLKLEEVWYVFRLLCVFVLSLVGCVIIAIVLIVVIFLFISLLFYFFLHTTKSGIIYTWLCFIAVIVYGGYVGFIILLSIQVWIKSNWEKAGRIVKEEMEEK